MNFLVQAGNFCVDMINWTIKGLGAILQMVLLLLPETPFRVSSWHVPEVIISFNEFFPISECVAVFEIWVICIAAYYGYSIILRWLKAVE